MPDGKIITGADLKKLWAKVDFVVTGDDYGANRAGEALWNDGNPLFMINADHLKNYALQDGTDFYVLHELAHVTDAGRLNAQQQWDAYRNATSDELESASHYSESSWFKAGEQFANTLARAAAELSGLPKGTYFDKPTHGYLDGTTTITAS